MGDFFTKEEAMELLKRSTATASDLITHERTHISKAAENGCYKVVIKYDLSGDKVQILRDLGFFVNTYDDIEECYISTIKWDKPQKPKDKIPGMDEEDIEDFNAIKMYMRAKEVNAATLREVKKIIAPILERDNRLSDKDTVILDKELSNRISISSEVIDTIMAAGFDLVGDYHGRLAVCWSRLKYEARKQQRDEGNNDFLKEVMDKVRNSASEGFFNVNVTVCSDSDLYEKTEERLTSLGYIVHKTAFDNIVNINWYGRHLFNKSDSKILDACQARNMAINFNKYVIKKVANKIKDLRDDTGWNNISIRKEFPPLTKKVLEKHGVSIVKDQFAENDETYIITWRDMLENALNDMVTDELLM